MSSFFVYRLQKTRTYLTPLGSSLPPTRTMAMLTTPYHNLTVGRAVSNTSVVQVPTNAVLATSSLKTTMSNSNSTDRSAITILIRTTKARQSSTLGQTTFISSNRLTNLCRLSWKLALLPRTMWCRITHHSRSSLRHGSNQRVTMADKLPAMTVRLKRVHPKPVVLTARLTISSSHSLS